MTKEASNSNPNVAVHNERLMVSVRVRPMGHLSEANRAIMPISDKALVFTEGPNYSGEKSYSDPEFFGGSGSGSSGGGKGPFSFPTPASRAGSNFKQHFGAQAQNGGSFSDGRIYEFDHVFDEGATQEEVYRATAAPLVRSVFEGFCATCFAYGATSSGKTHTMVGTGDEPGIMKRAIDDIFVLSSDPQRENKTEVNISYLEIYNEKIRDLLRPLPGVHLELREDTEQVHVSGLSELRATSTAEVMGYLQKGNKARTTEPTATNVTSSRSHAILLVTVRQTSEDEREVTDGKLYLIDLAGSERASHTKVKNSGLRLREGGHINRSLLALGNCITALAAGDDKYINYRDSKLTRLLKAALGGPSKTVMIAHMSPSVHQREETRNTLTYASRARAISNRVRKFVYPGTASETGAIIEELRAEVRRLQGKLDLRVGNNNSNNRIESSLGFSRNASTTPTNAFYHEGYIDKHEKHELLAIKSQITALFENEFRLRNDLLKLDGAMLQSALDCEILRLMVLDWENLKGGNRENENLEELDSGQASEIHSVMKELKQVRSESDKILNMRNDVESELRKVRKQISVFEEEASSFLPEIQREILSLLCKLQQQQLSKMSVEIEAELKRRGSLLLRCLRQKALGEAIIHRQRSFISAISGRSLTTPQPRFLPPLQQLSSPVGGSISKPSSGERTFAEFEKDHLPPLSKSLPPHEVSMPIPTTTKYSDFRAQRQLIQRQLGQSSSEEDNYNYTDDKVKYERGKYRKNRNKSPAYPSY